MGIQLVLIKMFELLGHTDVQISNAKRYFDHMACDAGDNQKFSKYQYDVILGCTLKYSPPLMSDHIPLNRQYID